MSDTEFKDSKGNFPAEVSFRRCLPMWSYPPAVVNSSFEDISIGMDVTHVCENPNIDKDALIAQCRPIVCFKALTVMQSMGIIASRTIPPSSDVQGGSRERTYCPSTYIYGHAYDTPTRYSDILSCSTVRYPCLHMSACSRSSFKNQMSNKPYCANADAPSSVVSGMMISLTPYDQPKADRIGRLIETRDFDTVEEMVENFNSILSQAPDFAKVPDINYQKRICYPKSREYSQYKICPETECEELVYALDQVHDRSAWSARSSTVEAIRAESRSLLDVVQSSMGKRYLEMGEQENQRQWRSGSSRRAYSAHARRPKEKKEITLQDRMTNPEETALAW